jgi:tol-pal system protein YbgF
LVAFPSALFPAKGVSVIRFVKCSALLLALAGAMPAQAGLFSDDEARAEVKTVRSQLDDATRRLESVTQNQGEFTNQVEAIKADIAKLRGQIDELSYNLDAAQKRQKDFYVDLDNRLRKIETQGQTQQTETDAKAQAAKATEASAMRDYETALAALKNSDCKSAVRGFESFIAAAPNSPQQASAHFFAAYCYAHLNLHAKAADLYYRLVENWPNDEHAPDAMLGRAESFEAMGQKKEARIVLSSLATRYPASDAGKQAKVKLKKK